MTILNRLFKKNILHSANHDISHISLILENEKLPMVERIVIIVIFLFFASFISWANFAEFDEMIVGNGIVNTVQDPHVIQHLDGGIVQNVFVQEGQIVNAGSPILKMDSNSLERQVQQLDIRAKAAKANLERWRLITDWYEELLAGRLVKSKTHDLTDNLLLDATLESWASQKTLISTEIATMDSQLDKANLEYIAAKQQHALLAEDFNRRNELVKRGVQNQLSLINLKREVSGSKNDVAAAKLRILEIRSLIDEKKQRLKDLGLSQIKEARERYLEAVDKQAALEQQMLSLNEQISRAIILAPFRGIVSGLPYTNTGQVVSPSDEVLTLIPVDTELQVLTEIAPEDISNITLFDRAKIKIVSYDFTRRDGIDGFVSYISADSLVNDQGNRYFMSKLLFDNGAFRNQFSDIVLMPGMKADVYILTGKKTIFEYLLKPIYRAFDQAFSEQ